MFFQFVVVTAFSGSIAGDELKFACIYRNVINSFGDSTEFFVNINATYKTQSVEKNRRKEYLVINNDFVI